MTNNNNDNNNNNNNNNNRYSIEANKQQGHIRNILTITSELHVFSISHTL
jgi:hypothetical protein